MHKERFVFAQLAEFLNGDKFRHIVDKYNGNNYVNAGPNVLTSSQNAVSVAV